MGHIKKNEKIKAYMLVEEIFRNNTDALLDANFQKQIIKTIKTILTKIENLPEDNIRRCNLIDNFQILMKFKARAIYEN